MIAIDLDDLPFQVAIVSRSRVSLRNWLPRPQKKMLYTKGTCKSSTFSKTPMLANIYIYIQIEDVQSYVQSVNQKVDKEKQHKTSISKLLNIESISKEIPSGYD